jgi:hypothetical protein
MADFRKLLIVFIITVLFTVFVFSLNAAVNESPKYENYCKGNYGMTKPIPAGYMESKNCSTFVVPDADNAACIARSGNIEYTYDSNNCATGFACNTCQHEFNLAQERYKFWQFIIAAAFGLVAIIVGLFIPGEKDSLNESLSLGFLLGGLITLFIGTALSFTTLYKWLRPGIILVELLIVIFIAYRKFKTKK